MNLVVAVGSRAVADRYTTVVDEVTASLPSRAIVVALEPDAPTRAARRRRERRLRRRAKRGARSARSASGSTRAGASARGSRARSRRSCVPRDPDHARLARAACTRTTPCFAAMATSAQRVILDSEYTSLASLIELERWSRRPHAAEEARVVVAPPSPTWRGRGSRRGRSSARASSTIRERAHATAITRVALNQASDQGGACSAPRGRCSSGGSRRGSVGAPSAPEEVCACGAPTGATWSCEWGRSRCPGGWPPRRSPRS